MNKVLLCICILKGLLCCIKQLPPAAALDLACWVTFLCAGKRHWEFFHQMHPSVFIGLWELNVSMFLQSSAIINIPTVAFLQLCSVVVNGRLVRVCLLRTVPLERHCSQPRKQYTNRFYSSYIYQRLIVSFNRYTWSVRYLKWKKDSHTLKIHYINLLRNKPHLPCNARSTWGELLQTSSWIDWIKSLLNSLG